MNTKQTNKHPHHLHVFRIILFALLILALFLTKSVEAHTTQITKQQSAVLAYATNVSISGLLSATNSHRSANGLAPLTLDGQLNSSAQSKAQHMITYNYWSHVAPDGTQPWYFFTQAGYNYASAGENLAYGFDSSQGAVDAWMNSASHRANILGSYNDVGFGIANGDNYQGGPNTVIVAHYGTRQAPPPPAPAPTPAPTPSGTTQSSTPPASPTTAATPVAEEPAPETVEPLEPAEQAPAPTDSQQTPLTKPANVPDVTVAATKDISLFESIKQRQAPLFAVAGLGITVAATGGFAMTHRRLFRHALATGENFVIHHPIIDFSAVAVATLIILTTTISRIG